MFAALRRSQAAGSAPSRWRIRPRTHPGPGFASIGELWFRWSRHAAINHGRRARPGLRFRHRERQGRRITRSASAGASGPPRLRADGGPGPPDGRAAHRQERHRRRPDPRSSRPGARHQHPRGPVWSTAAPGAARPGARVQPAGRRRRPLVAGLGSPRPLQGPGDGPPDGLLAQGARHRRGPAVVPAEGRRRADGPAVGRRGERRNGPGRV